MNQRALHRESINDPVNFWGKQAMEISWKKFPSVILQQRENGYQDWFVDGEINMSYLCLDHHISQRRGDQTALIYDSPVSGIQTHYTYNELFFEVGSFAAGLEQRGIRKGETVIIYMPMIPQAIIAMLACARIGVVHSVVFGGFAPHELAVRIDDCKPAAIITADYGIEVEKVIPYTPLVKAALAESEHQPETLIVYKRGKHEVPVSLETAIDFESVKVIGEIAECATMLSTDPLYILYTSGTTGKPKGVLRDTGGYATALKFAMTYFYNTLPGEVFFAASDLGWVVGHSFITYGPLIQGCTTVLYEGKPVRTPDAGAFWRLIEQYKIATLFAAPTAIRAIRKEDPTGILLSKYNTSSLKTFFLAGERCDITTYNWLADLLQKPVIDHWWQTESGWPMIGVFGNDPELSPKAGSAGYPIPGFAISILDEEGHELPQGREGFIAIKLPLPPGCLSTLWNNEARFLNGYLRPFSGYYASGDGGYIDEDGFVYVMGRVDDVINVSGHRLSTGEMEELITTHPEIAECAVVGVRDELKGQLPMAFVVTHTNENGSSTLLHNELIQLIRDKIGPIACFHKVVTVERLPKTRSGKILRKTIRQIVDGESYTIPSTIEDASVLDEITAALQKTTDDSGTVRKAVPQRFWA